MLAWNLNQKKFWRRYLFFAVLSILLIGLGWNYLRPKKVEYKTERPQFRDVLQTLEFTGQITANERAQMRFVGGGKVIYLGAQEGDSVKRGQTIASIDRRSLEKSLEKTLSTYETQRRNFENADDARPEYLTTETERRDMEKDQFALDRSVIDVEIQSIAIEDTRLSAPFNGILISSPVTVIGVPLAATDVFEIVNPETLYFQLYVDEVDIDEIFIGQEALVRLDSRPDEVLHAKVTDIALKAGQSSSGTVFPVELTFTDSIDIQKQRLGMNGEAAVVLGEADAVLSIPTEAIVYREDGSFVEVLVNGKPEQRVVDVGVESDEFIQIVSGLSADDEVILP